MTSDRGDGARQARAHRRWIRALKILLPTAALGVFASLFVFNSASYDDAISFDGVDLAALNEGLRLVNPRFTGATNRGEPFTVSAAWAQPDGPRPERVELNSVAGEINLVDGRIVTLSAESGVLFPRENLLTLDDGVRFASSDGYLVTALSARLDAENETLTAEGEVTASGAIGKISADSMRAERWLRAAGDEGGDDAAARSETAPEAAAKKKDAYIWFENRVKVRIEDPKLAQE